MSSTSIAAGKMATMKITTPEEFRAARAARIEARRAEVEASAKAIVEEFDARLAAGDDVFTDGRAYVGGSGTSKDVAECVETILRDNGWRADTEEDEDREGSCWTVVYEAME